MSVSTKHESDNPLVKKVKFLKQFIKAYLPTGLLGTHIQVFVL